jgi:hypothetical protein
VLLDQLCKSAQPPFIPADSCTLDSLLSHSVVTYTALIELDSVRTSHRYHVCFVSCSCYSGMLPLADYCAMHLTMSTCSRQHPKLASMPLACGGLGMTGATSTLLTALLPPAHFGRGVVKTGTYPPARTCKHLSCTMTMPWVGTNRKMYGMSQTALQHIGPRGMRERC